MRILSVDDKTENLYMVEALLRGHGHEVDSASNGYDALQLARRGRYDLVISDILMPRMDGFQLCRELKKDALLRHVPVVFYTATYTDAKDAAFALSLGAVRFLTKPLDPETFVAEVEAVAREAAVTPVAPAVEAPEEESIYLKQYNARLIAKLEKKMLDLECANKALQEDLEERERAHRARERLELQLHRAQKMEALGTLAGGIAHDFNNILASIIGYAELGLHDIPDREASFQHFREILRASHRARELINQILTFSRHRDHPRQPLDLKGAVGEALQLLQPTIPAGITLTFTPEPDLPTVLADATQVHQLVANLVTNAWHAIGQAPGRIEVRIARFEVDETFTWMNPGLTTGPHIRVSVSDSGHGMPGEIAERIFEPFFTTKESGKGTGLGLAVVHGIMEASGGRVTVESVPGQGTTFHLYFPVLATENSEPGGSPAAPRGHGERILLVDDEPVLATLGDRLLRRLGYEPLALTDAAEALARIREQEYALVITDLTMPLMSGLDVARAIWRLRPRTPILLTTGYTASIDRAKALELGFCDLLVKPYTVQSLGQAVERALSAPAR